MKTFVMPDSPESGMAAIERKRKIAEMLATQGMTQQQGQMVGGRYIAPSPLSGIVQIGQILAAQHMNKGLDQQQSELEASRRTGMAEQLQKFMTTREGAPGQTMTDQQAENLMVNDQAPALADPVKADPRRAVLEAMTSQYPEMRQIGQMELGALLKPKSVETGLGIKELLPYADPSSIPQLLSQGPAAFQPKPGKADLQDISIGDGLWRSFEVGPDGRVDLNKPVGQPFSKRPTASSVSVNEGGMAVPKELAKAQPEIFKEMRQTAQVSLKTIRDAETVERLARDPQTIAGATAKPELFFVNLGARLGFTGPEAASKTQELLRTMAQSTLNAVKQLPGAISEKELPFLEQAAAGQITFTPQAILRIAQAQKATAHNALQDVYRMRKSNQTLEGGDAYSKAYPLPHQGTYQLDPTAYEVDQDNFATLRDQPAAALKGTAAAPMSPEEYLQHLKTKGR